MSIATTSFTSYNFQKQRPSAVHNKSSAPSTKLEYCSSARRGAGLLSINRRGRPHRTLMMDLNAVNNIPSGSSIPSGSPLPGGWSISWLLWTIIPLVIPLLKNKWAPFIALKHRMDNALETVECIAETIEDVARRVDNIADEVTENLPKDSKFREIVERIDRIAEETVKGADGVEELLQKIDDTTDQVEDILTQSSKEKADILTQSAKEKAEKATPGKDI